MHNDEFFAHSVLTTYASNLAVPASELSGWLRVERGGFNVFVASRESGEYGRRHRVAALEEGDCFPRCAGIRFPDENGVEYDCLLVSQGESVCRIANDEEFSAFLRDNPNEANLVFNRLLSRLTADWMDGEGEFLQPQCVDVETFPGIFQSLVRRALERISRQQATERADIRTERRNQRDAMRSKFSRLQNLVRPLARKTETPADPLIAALQIIARTYSLRVYAEPPDDGDMDPESRLLRFCSINQWRTRRIQLENGFSRLHHSALIGFHGADARPCILELAGDDSVWYFPGDGGKTRLNRRAESEFKPLAYCFYEQFPNRRLGWRDILAFLFKGSRNTLLCVILVGILVGLFGLVTPVATKYVTGKIIPTANYIELWQLLVLLVSLTAGTVLLNIVPQLIMLTLGATFLERFMAALFDRVFRLPVNFFKGFDAGDLCSRLFAAIRVQETVFLVLSQQCIGSIFSVCGVVLLFYYNWKLALFAVPLALLYGAVLLSLFLRLRKPLRDAVDSAGRQSGFLRQVIDAMAKIRGSGAEARVGNRFLDEFIRERSARVKIGKGMGLTSVAAVVFPAIANMIFFYLIGDIWRGGMETPGFLAFLSAYGTFQAGIIGIGAGIWQLATQKPELERMEIFWNSDVESPEGKPQAGKLDGSLELSHVTFGYDPELPPTLRDISFSVKPGEFVAIVGPSGAGKSSLVRLLLGFETPDNGSILYSGRDLREVDVNSVRRQLGVILQNSRIMPASILDNITTGTGCSLADAERAARLAALDKDIRAMPMGIFTMVADGLVSGGQQQRILIARAVVGDPTIILMDESTSALDNETQDEVRRNLETLKATRIVIAHRLSTIVNADRIYVLDKGEIRQSGTAEELMNQDGVFKRLAERQLL